MKKHKKSSIHIDKSWTLFLDRDGVINKHIKNGYVLKWKDFKFLPHFLKTISKLSKLFNKIIIITNQRCIAKKLITKSQLDKIHQKMLKKIRQVNGRIDKIYYCPHDITDNCKCRKPKTGMALKAKKQFKNIKFSKSIIIGDSKSDMELGKKCKMTTIYKPNKSLKSKTTNADFTVKDFREVVQLINS